MIKFYWRAKKDEHRLKVYQRLSFNVDLIPFFELAFIFSFEAQNKYQVCLVNINSCFVVVHHFILNAMYMIRS